MLDCPVLQCSSVHICSCCSNMSWFLRLYLSHIVTHRNVCSPLLQVAEAVPQRVGPVSPFLSLHLPLPCFDSYFTCNFCPNIKGTFYTQPTVLFSVHTVNWYILKTEGSVCVYLNLLLSWCVE